jgi:hypothetical protein
MIALYHIQMFRSLMIAMLALALSALPFGMGAMMAAQAASHNVHAGEPAPASLNQHHASHAGHGLHRPGPRQGQGHAGHGAPADSNTHHDSSAHIHFAACGSCLSLPPAEGFLLLFPSRQRLPEVLPPAPLHRHDTLPALPPPRA